MNLEDYLLTIRKVHCPPDCKFNRYRKIEIALIPPPDEILGILISRDPTMRWHEKDYRRIRNKHEEDTRTRKELFDVGIPNSLINQMELFMGNRIGQKDKNCLSDVLSTKVYWTHLHKCFTNSSVKSLKFDKNTGMKCANKWLTQELDYAISKRTRFVVALGREVQDGVDQWKKNQGRQQTVKVIELLHPSRQNDRVWRRSAMNEIEKTEAHIGELIKLCGEDRNY